ncbi:MAG: GIY-YIG nuclease family protein [Christensenella sp.]
MDKTNYIYILLCADNTLYTGWTNDIKKRLAAHQAGRGAKYTKGRLPVKLVYTETHATKQGALRRERAIKALKRNAKLALINNNK